METSNQYPIITELTNYHSKVCKKQNSKNVFYNGNSRLRSRSPRSAIEKSHLMVNNPILDGYDHNGDNDDEEEDGEDGDGDDDDSNAVTVSRIKREPQRSVSGEKERGMGEKNIDGGKERSREGERDVSRERNREKGRDKGREMDDRREQNTMKKVYTKDFNEYDVVDRSKVGNKERIKIISLDKVKMMNKDTLGVSIGKYEEKKKDDRYSEMGDELAELYDREKDRNNDYERGSDHRSEDDNHHENEHENGKGRDNKNGNGNGHVREYHQDVKKGKESEREQRERGREREDDNDDEDEDEDEDDSDSDSEDEREERRERRRQEEKKEDKVYRRGRSKVTTLDMARVRNSNSNSFYEIRSIKSKEKGKERFLELEKNIGELREVRDSSRSPRYNDLRELRDSSRSPRYNDSKSRPHLIGVRR
jgi:hypothetical protein